MTDLSDHVNQDQIRLILKNLLHVVVCKFAYYNFLILDCLSAYTLLPYSISQRFIQDLCSLISIMLEDLKYVFSLFKLNFIVFIIALKSTKNIILNGNREENRKHAFEVYQKMKEILKHFNTLPLSSHNSLIAYLILKKIPDFVWQKLLPFPSFLFEDTFAKSPERDTIYKEFPPPESASILMVKSKDNTNKTVPSSSPSNVRKSVSIQNGSTTKEKSPQSDTVNVTTIRNTIKSLKDNYLQ